MSLSIDAAPIANRVFLEALNTPIGRVVGRYIPDSVKGIVLQDLCERGISVEYCFKIGIQGYHYVTLPELDDGFFLTSKSKAVDLTAECLKKAQVGRRLPIEVDEKTEQIVIKNLKKLGYEFVLHRGLVAFTGSTLEEMRVTLIPNVVEKLS